MPGTGRLRGGLERALPDHRSALGQALRREYRALLVGLGIDVQCRHGAPSARRPPSLLEREASRAAWAVVRAREASRAWAAAIEKRRSARGRRPSPRAVERAARRAALDDHAATAAVDRLRELATRNGRPSDPLVAVRQAVADANRA
jgi:hypothetical protein